MNENLMPDMYMNNNSNNRQNKKTKWKFIIGGLIIVLVLALLLFFGWRKISRDPIGIYNTAINEVYNYLEEKLDDSSDSKLNIDVLKDPVVLDLTTKISSNNKELKDLTKYTYDLSLGLDYNNEKGSIGLGLKDDDEAIVNILAMLQNKNIYLRSEELFSKAIKVGEYDLFGELTSAFDTNYQVSYDTKDLEIVLDEMKTILSDSLSKDKFKLEDTTLNIKDKDYKLKKITYTLDKENAERTIKFIINKIRDNEKLKESLANILNYSSSTLNSELDYVIDTLDLSSYETINIEVYTDIFNKPMAIYLKEGENTHIEYINVSTPEVTIKSDTLVMNITNEKINIKVIDGKEELLNASIIIKDKKWEISFKLTQDKDSINGSITLDDITMNSTKTSFESNFKLSLIVSIDGDKTTLDLDGKLSLTKKGLGSINPDSAVYYEDLTEEEIGELSTKLKGILEKLNLLDLVSI